MAARSKIKIMNTKMLTILPESEVDTIFVKKPKQTKSKKMRRIGR